MTDFLLEEIPKHHKKKQSTVSKSKSKAKHKHTYKDCLLVHESTHKPYKALYCADCGKIYDFKFFISEITTDGLHRILDDDEVYAKYDDLPQFLVHDVWQKYVAI